MNNQKESADVFFALLRAGLWEQSVRLLSYAPVDFDALYQWADEQSVVGLIAAGLEHVEDMRITKPQAVPFMKKVVALEQRNSAMNEFISVVFEKMRKQGISSLLVKGQGIAQNYERPQWRAAGDVDILLDQENYEKAKAFLIPQASKVELEDAGKLHLEMKIDSWSLELHGTLRNGLTRRINRVIDRIQNDALHHGDVKIWHNEGSDIPIPGPDNNVVFIFSHILQHFFHGGIGLRQICDWSRLLWTYRGKVDINLLESRLREMRLMTEWKAFSSLAVNYLGLTPEAAPFFDQSDSYRRKADRIVSIILEKGNFGHNVDSSYISKAPILKRKLITIWRQFKDTLSVFTLFPLDSFRFLSFFIIDGFDRTRTTTKFAFAKQKK